MHQRWAGIGSAQRPGSDLVSIWTTQHAGTAFLVWDPVWTSRAVHKFLAWYLDVHVRE